METATDIHELQSVGTIALEPASISVAPLSAVRQRVNDFYELTKPRMNFLVVITTMVGYYMASEQGRGGSDWTRLIPTIFGTALTAAGASVFNQFIERRLDVRMKRTQNR